MMQRKHAMHTVYETDKTREILGTKQDTLLVVTHNSGQLHYHRRCVSHQYKRER